MRLLCIEGLPSVAFALNIFTVYLERSLNNIFSGENSLRGENIMAEIITKFYSTKLQKNYD